MSKREEWVPATFGRETFLCFLERTSVKETTAEVRARSLSRTITAACDASMSIKLNHSGRHQVYWWYFAILRKECLRDRRLHKRAVRGLLYAELTTSYEQKRKELKIVIKTAKRKRWQDFYEEVVSDPWGRPYETVTNKIKPRGTSTPSGPNFLDKVHWCSRANSGYRIVSEGSGQKDWHKKDSRTGWQ